MRDRFALANAPSTLSDDLHRAMDCVASPGSKILEEGTCQTTLVNQSNSQESSNTYATYVELHSTVSTKPVTQGFADKSQSSRAHSLKVPSHLVTTRRGERRGKEKR